MQSMHDYLTHPLAKFHVFYKIFVDRLKRVTVNLVQVQRPGQNASQEGKLVPIKLCHPTQVLGNYTPKKTYLWSGVVFFEQFKNPESTVWCVLALEQEPRSLVLPGDQTMAI